MYIRKVKSRKSTCFQIGYKRNGKFKIVKHVGCASSLSLIEALKIKAKNEMVEILLRVQPPLFSLQDKPPKAKLKSWRITGYHQIFGKVYDLIGFPNNLLRDLVVARIVHPSSKLSMVRFLNSSLGIDLSVDRVYRFLDSLSKSELTKTAFEFVSQKAGGISLIFYDVTTLYFETNNEDTLREKGYSKDHRHDMPQIVLGLFVDKNGYPFDFDFFSGKTFEGHTFSKAIKNLLDKYHFKNLTVVADAGMLSGDNLDFLLSLNLNYIVGARIKNMTDEIKKQILMLDFKNTKIHEIELKEKKNKDKNCKRLIIDYSEDRARKDNYNRDKIVKKLETKLEKKQAVVYKNKYLVFQDEEKAIGVNQTKIEEDKKYDGLKGYLTNIEKEKVENEKIIEEYHNLWKIEKAFRMSKNDLQERPIYHRNFKRIESHLLICFCSLLVMKETENKLSKINISMSRAIETIGSVGEGTITIGGIELPIEKEIGYEAKLILDAFLGH